MTTKDDARREMEGMLGHPEYYALQEEESKHPTSEATHKYWVYIHKFGWHMAPSWREALDKLKKEIQEKKEETA